ncbi:actin-binding LIM protein 1-like isoform X5 [Lineus longissimus]|uniref:actin-binding LIM protein 1-like isoform X5 n=1 Tax=Lineus longissimus TaxID=88925 RepID=UPI00315D4FFA
MGKVVCHVCKKKCKGEVLKLQDKYFHSECFKCKACSTLLSSGGFFLKDGDYYCPDDYQKLFGTRCHTCGKFVEGEVVTALGNTFHQECFHCYQCRKDFEPGDKVTYNGQQYYCKPCAEKIQAIKAPKRRSPSPESGRRGGKATEREGRKPQRTSTPFKGEMAPELNHTSPEGDSAFLDNNEEVLTPSEQQYNYRTPSPASSLGSRSSSRSGSLGRPRVDSGVHHDPKFDVDYGKMYPKSYLEKDKEVMNDSGRIETDKYKRSQSPGSSLPPKSPHFHRPENFSYSKVKTAYIKPMKKGYIDQGMMVLEAKGIHRYPLNRASSESAAAGRKSPAPLNNEEPIMLSHYPGGHHPEPYEQARIERDDWPGPPCPAAILPGILRDKIRAKVEREAREERLAELQNSDDIDDPKIKREIEQILKMIGEGSGMSAVVLKDLEIKKKRAISPTLDPRSASRTPSAAIEPHHKTRYESPVFASPSRDRDRPRMIHKGPPKGGKASTLPYYPGDAKANSSVTPAHSGNIVRNYPPVTIVTMSSLHTTVPISHGNHIQRRNVAAARPGYTFGLASKSASLPGSARDGVDLDNYEYHTNNHDASTSIESTQSIPVQPDPVVVKHRANTSNSSMDRDGQSLTSSSFRYPWGRYQGCHYTEVLNHTPNQVYMRRSLPNMNEPIKVYPYDALKVNTNLPKDVDRNQLERYLSTDDFEKIFQMSRAQFYRQAEWRRNDMKRRVLLY